MAAAPEDRERPRLAESADLVGSAISMRLRRTRVRVYRLIHRPGPAPAEHDEAER
jgi:hypothetical protein